MASGFDARVALSKESTYGTRVVPARFLPLTAEDFGFDFGRYFSPAMGTGLWGRPSIVVNQVGRGAIRGDAPSTGFSFLLDGLHGNVVTPASLGGAPIAYSHTHTLSTPPTKSWSAQVQNPPVNSNTLVPHDMLGVMMAGITLSWSASGVLSYEIPVVYQTLDLAQTLVTYVAPAAYELFSFQGGKITIGGTLETNIVGDGSLSIEYPLRDDAFTLGSNGKIAKPVITDKPRGMGSFTADFNDNTNLNRVINNTNADVVMTFEGATISGANKSAVIATLPGCVFTSPRATADDPGPVQQEVSFETASSTGVAPSIVVITAEATL